MSHSFTTPNQQLCEQTRPLIKHDYETGVIRMENTDLMVDRAVPICVKMSSG